MSNRQERRRRRTHVTVNGDRVSVVHGHGDGQLLTGGMVDKVMSGERVPDPDGRHLWVATAMWKVDPRAIGPMVLDVENLLMTTGPGCYWCEQPYSAELAARLCVPVP